jgi:Na+/proline symporter
MVGFLITVVAIVPDLFNNWAQLSTSLPETFFSAVGDKGPIFLITMFLAFLLGETFAPGYATRYCIGQDIKSTRKGIVGIGLTLSVTFPVIIFVIAIYARANFPDIDPQYALPAVLSSLHHPVLSGIMIAALLSAVMSSADSALNSSTAIFVKDLFEHQLKWEKSDKELLRLARWFTVILGVFSTLIAVLWPNIIDLLLFTYHLWAPAIILPVVYGALAKRRDRALNQSILITMLVATVGTMIYRFLPWAETLDPAVFGVLLSLATFFLANSTMRMKTQRI